MGNQRDMDKVIGKVEFKGEEITMTLKTMAGQICKTHQPLNGCRQLLIPGIFVITDLEYLSEELLKHTSTLLAEVGKMKEGTVKERAAKREKTMEQEDFNCISRHLLDLLLIEKVMIGDINCLDDNIFTRIKKFVVSTDDKVTSEYEEYLHKVKHKLL
jgi:hypothetical protein